MKKPVVSVEDENIKKISIIFKSFKKDFKDETKFKKTHYFDKYGETNPQENIEISGNLKRILLKELNLDTFKELKEYFNCKWDLIISDYNKTFVDKKKKKVTIMQ